MLELDASHWLILLAAVFAVAFFYSSVGHGGATGYLAALALIGVAPASAEVAVLIANVLVASIAWWRFTRRDISTGECCFRSPSPPCPARVSAAKSTSVRKLTKSSWARC